jgi:hypothetical protein
MLKKNSLKFLSLVFLASLITCACVGVGRFYWVISEPFELKDDNTVTRTFSLPVENSRSVDLFFAFSSSEINKGRFRINNHAFVEFEVAKDDKPDIPPDGIEIIMNLPRSWFQKDNTIVFEHLSGGGISVQRTTLTFNEFQTSPYEN